VRSHPDYRGQSDEALLAILKKQECEGELLDDLALVPAQIVGKEQELWSNWDRVQAEGTFRLTVAVPLAALGIAVVWTSVTGFPAWLATAACVAFAALLGGLGASKRRDAAEILLQAVQSKRVEPLDFQQRLSTDPSDWLKN
jgi:hypothetical protein